MAKPSELTLSFVQRWPQHAARVLEELNSDDVAAFVSAIPKRVAGPAAGHMLRWRAAKCIELLSPDQAAGLIENMDYYDAVGLLQVTARNKRDAVLAELSRSLANRIRASLRYPEGTVGALMDPSVPIFAQDATADQALRYVKEWHRTDISHVFLRGGQGSFHGAVRIAALVRAAGKADLASIADRKVVPISNRATLVSITQDSEWDDYPMRPVVGTKRRLLGGLSRSALRHSMNRLAPTRTQLEPTALVANAMTVYLHSCRNLFGFAAQLPGASNARAGTGAVHGRKR